ncbi:MAG: integrase family protein [Acidobacteriaceae bacterium]|nr:integrase family protein [Acidobacteriaceae bacterium]
MSQEVWSQESEQLGIELINRLIDLKNAGVLCSPSQLDDWLSYLKAKLFRALDFTATASPQGKEMAAVLVRDLFSLIERDYATKKRRSLRNIKLTWNKHLGPQFGGRRAASITATEISSYIAERQQQGAMSATINNESAMLKRMYQLAIEMNVLKPSQRPYVPILPTNNARSGFVPDAQYEALARETQKVGLWLRAMFEVAITYGWRKGELLDLRVGQVNLSERTISLEGSQTKNGKSRCVVMSDLVFELLTQCVARKNPDDHVFTRLPRTGTVFRYRASKFWWTQFWQDGKPVRESAKTESETEAQEILRARIAATNTTGRPVANFAKDWKRVVKRAGCPNLLFHDLRRSAVRNMVRDGVREKVAMEISGHQTRSIFDRYHIIDPDDLRDASARMQRGAAQRLQATRKLPQREGVGSGAPSDAMASG